MVPLIDTKLIQSYTYGILWMGEIEFWKIVKKHQKTMIKLKRQVKPAKPRKP